MTREVFTGFVAEESVRRRDAGSPQIRASGGARGAPQGADGGAGDGSARGGQREAHPGERNGQVILLQVQRARDRL